MMQSQHRARRNSEATVSPLVRRAVLLTALVGFLAVAAVAATVAQMYGQVAGGTSPAGKAADAPQRQASPFSQPTTSPSPMTAFAGLQSPTSDLPPTGTAPSRPAAVASISTTPGSGILFKVPDLHFSVQPECCHSGLFGFAVAPDGTFWVGDQTQDIQARNPRILHYSAGGTLLGTIQVPQITNLYDVKVGGRDILALDGEQSFNKVVRYSQDGHPLAVYKMSELMDKGGPPGLIIGEQGEVLLGGLSDRSYGPARQRERHP